MNTRFQNSLGAPSWSNAASLAIACPVLLGVLFLLDLALSPALGVWAFYAVAVVAAVPSWDRRLVTQLAAAAASLMMLHTVLEHNLNAQPVMLLLNSVIGLLAVWVVLRLSQEVIETHELQLRNQRNQDLPGSPMVNGQNRMLTMCAWTKRIKDGDRWVSIEEFLGQRMNMVVTHGISDETKDRLLRSVQPR